MPRLGSHLLRRGRGLRDATVARDMREFAEVFVEGAAADDYALDYDAATVARLDPLCDMFLAGEPDEDVRNSMAMSMGAFLGELLVRTAGGRWAHDPERRMAAVEMPDGRRLHPHHAVHERLTRADAPRLAAFHADAVAVSNTTIELDSLRGPD